MKTKLYRLKQSVYAVIALALMVTVTFPALTQDVAAAQQVQTRSVEMSSAAASATGVSYQVSFKPQTSVSAGGGIVVDICDNDPLIGDSTCSFPTGFDWGGASPTLTVNSGMGSSPDWAAAGVQGGAGAGKSQALKLTSTTTGTLTASTQATFTISSVTNPSTANHTFYARILTFDTAAHMNTEYFGGSFSGTTRNSTFADMQDYGGVAMSTSSTITITANVMEQITFCVSGVAIDDTSGACSTTGGLTAPALTIGHGSPTKALDSTAVDTATAFTEVSTNAASGVIVRMKAGNTCTNLSAPNQGGLSTNGGSTCAIEGSGNKAVIAAGTPSGNPGGSFGLCVHAAGSATVATTYDDTGSGSHCPTSWSSTVDYGMNGTNVTSTYGDQIYSTTGAVNEDKNQCTFAATASTTTPAGIYQGSESLIATGTF